MLRGGNDAPKVGKPTVSGAKVVGKILRQDKAARVLPQRQRRIERFLLPHHVGERRRHDLSSDEADQDAPLAASQRFRGAAPQPGRQDPVERPRNPAALHVAERRHAGLQAQGLLQLDGQRRAEHPRTHGRLRGQRGAAELAANLQPRDFGQYPIHKGPNCAFQQRQFARLGPAVEVDTQIVVFESRHAAGEFTCDEDVDLTHRESLS